MLTSRSLQKRHILHNRINHLPRSTGSPIASMSSHPSALPAYIIIRRFHPNDQEAVFKLWYDGFAELFWEGASKTWTSKKLLASLGLGSAVPLALMLRSSSAKASGSLDPATAAALVALYTVGAAAVWAASAPVTYWTQLWQYRAMFAESEMHDVQKNWVENNGRSFWVACLSDGTVVGATALRMERPPPPPLAEGAGEATPAAAAGKGPSGFRDLEEGQGELLRMTVSSRHRRLQLGSRLLNVLEDHAKASGLTRVTLTTAALPAMTFYERNGYVVVKEMDHSGWTVKTYEKVL